MSSKNNFQTTFFTNIIYLKLMKIKKNILNKLLIIKIHSAQQYANIKNLILFINFKDTSHWLQMRTLLSRIQIDFFCICLIHKTKRQKSLMKNDDDLVLHTSIITDVNLKSLFSEICSFKFQKKIFYQWITFTLSHNSRN